MRPYLKIIIILLVAGAILVVLNSCATLSYYGQSIAGQLEILKKQQPITGILERADTSDQLKSQFTRILQMREFASAELYLPDNRSYRTYADLERRFVVWNVIVTPEFSLDPVQWCFPVAGCLPYRGYFSEQDARRFAEQYTNSDHDVFIGGVSAYSTLGWFDDPVLNTMLQRGPVELARVMFHELAHQKIYIRDDTDFNEAFADTVARIGVRRWLEKKGGGDELSRFDQRLERQKQFVDLIVEYKGRLQALYLTKSPAADMRKRKTAVYGDMQEDYRKLQNGWGEHNDYESWFTDGPNNAYLATILTYQDLVPDFLHLFESQNGDFNDFYTRVAKIGACPKRVRRVLLAGNFEPRQCTGE